MNQMFQIDNLTIGDSRKPVFVAEIGLNHNNDLNIAQKTIEKAAKIGAHAVKFQSYITEEFIDSQNPEAKFLFDIFKKYELSEKMHRDLQKTAQENGVLFFSTPLCNSSVDLLDSLQVPAIKIASGDIVNKPLLQRVAKVNVPIFLSTGAAEFYEVVRAVEELKQQELENLCLFHCISLYPTPFDKLNLKSLELYRDMYQIPIGFSDHSQGYLAPSVATALGACVIEKHFTLDKELEGPDHGISASPEEFAEMILHCNQVAEMLGEKEKVPWKQEVDGRFFGRRSMYKREQGDIPLRPAMHLRVDDWKSSWE
ncbi:MAG: N-acetylneuraminate synthase family protein [Spirochaetota bacterium]